MKAIISQEREREKAERERRRLLKAETTTMTTTTPAEIGANGAQNAEGGENSLAQAQDPSAMDVDPEVAVKSEMDVMNALKQQTVEDEIEEVPTYTSIDAPPSIWPPKHYCDITGLEAPYTDPATGLRFHDKSIYQLVKGLSTSTAKDYLSARGVSAVVK